MSIVHMSSLLRSHNVYSHREVRLQRYVPTLMLLVQSTKVKVQSDSHVHL